MAYVAYVDDSGDESSFALGCVLVPTPQWLDVHDELVAFRSQLSKLRGFRMQHELKASHLVTPSASGTGPWRGLGVPRRTRIGIYRAALSVLDSLAPTVRTLAVVAPSREHEKFKGDAVEECWDKLMERLETFCRYNKTECILLPDDGNPATVVRLARRKRRFGYAPSAFGGSSRKVPFVQLVDDPFPRASKGSYLLQWADLVAPAAFRRVIPRQDVPPNLWEQIGASNLGEANRIERQRGSCNEPDGLIVWPDRRF